MEKKNKEVNMKSKLNEKLTYEQLEQFANSLNQQCRVLNQQLTQAQGIIAEFNEIGMLLDVIKQAEQFNPSFIERCANKIEELITKALDESDKQAQENDKN